MADASTRETANVTDLDTPAAHAKAAELGRNVLRMTTHAGSGHATSALSLCHIIVEMMYRQMRFDVSDPWNPANDRLVLSAGHAVPIVYAAYADLGGTVGDGRHNARPLTIADLDGLRERDSVLDGHPNPAEGFPFFDAATGSLGQGLSVAAGLALGARLDGHAKRIFVIIGDGESREGQVWEAADFLVDHGLNNVCAVFSCNGHGQAAPVSAQQSARALTRKMTAFGWAVVEIDGHDPDAVRDALDRAGQEDRPLAIVARTIKGWGVPSVQMKNMHGKPLAKHELDDACAELEATARALGGSGSPTPCISIERPTGPAACRTALRSVAVPDLAEACRRAGLSDKLEKRKMATRVAFGVGLLALGDADERIVSLDGDVSNSTFSNMFARSHPDRFFECRIAEQNMISAAAGLAATGKIPFASSFGKFLARGTDQIDLAAISRANIKLVGSHCGVSLGADGPSQMAVSDVAYFRSLTRVTYKDGEPVLRLFHPCDAISAYRCCELMANITGMCYLRTHRPDAPMIYPDNGRFDLAGCKQLRDALDARITLVGSGFMLHVVTDAANELYGRGINCNLFDAYALPMDSKPILEAARRTGTPILSVEDNYAGGVHAELAEVAAEAGDVRVVGMVATRIPKSAKTADEVFSYVGVGKEQIVDRAIAIMSS